MLKQGLFKRDEKIRLEQLKAEKLEIAFIEETTLLFVLEGEIGVLLDGKIIKITAGELFLLNPNKMVGIETRKSNLVLIVELETTKELLLDRKIRLDRPISTVYYQALFDEMTEILALLYLETVEAKEGYEAFISGYLDQIYGLILRYLPIEQRIESVDNQELSERMLEVMTYLNQHYQEDLNLDAISDEFHLSKYYLSHSFKKEVGITIGKYLEEVRLLNAVKTLTQTNETITDIAYANGFASTRAFVESFKKKRGVTPTQYRKEEETSTQSDRSLENSRDYLELFSKYIKPRNENVYARMEVIKKTLQLNKQPAARSKSHFIIKMFKENQQEKLALLSENTQEQFVAVDQIIDKILVQNSKGDLRLDFTPLAKELNLLIQYQLTPYLQLSVFDYECYQAKHPSLSFSEIIKRLKYFLESQYYALAKWRLEFRPFYEYEGTGELCQPLKEVIPLFQDTCALIVHMPKHFENFAKMTEVEATKQSVTIEVIDDFTRLQKLPLATVLKALEAPENLEHIQTNQNMIYQVKLLQHLEQLEEDGYYQQFDELIYANLMVWILFSSMNNHLQKSITPLTLDGKPLFYYFEEKLAQKLALISPTGMFRDSWYIFQFISKMFDEIVYKNDYCLITRRGEHYRMLFIHSEDFMESLKRLREDQEPEFGYKQPTAFIQLHLEGLEGSYRFIKEAITPGMRLSQKNQLKIEKDVKLLEEDIAYINQMRQPLRQVSQVEIENDFVIEEEIPLLGILFVEMIRTK